MKKNEKKHKQMNKKGMLIQTWVIAFLIFTGVFALMYLAGKGIADDYDESDIIKEDYRESYDVFEDVEDDYRGLFDEMGGENPSVWTILNPFSEAGIVNGLFDLISITFNSVRIMDDVTTDFVSDFGVPEQIANVIFPLLSAVIMVILIFGIINAINRGNKI